MGSDLRPKLQKATFGAGSFWHLEAAFRKMQGIMTTQVGYMGGSLENPSYEEVSTGHTGHAEVVELVYDPAIISYEQLLNVFWSTHNPAAHKQLDVHTQYRSVIFYHDQEQMKGAEASKLWLLSTGLFGSGVATEILPATKFWIAEDHHQLYMAKASRGVCHV